MWQDKWYSELEPAEKLLWFYLLTNPKTTQSGVYEYSERFASFDTGLSRKEVAQALERFREDGRILYNQEASEIMIVNWLKYNSARSPKVAMVIDRELGSMKTRDFAIKVIETCQQYEYPIRAKVTDLDTVSGSENTVPIPYAKSMDTDVQPEPEPTQNHNQNQQQKDAPSPAHAAAVDYRDAFRFYESNIGMMAPVVQQQIDDWCKDLGAELVIEAVKRAVEAGNGWKYAQGILKNWEKSNVRTLEQVNAQDTAFKRKQRPRGSRQEETPDWLEKDYVPEAKPTTPEMKKQIAEGLAGLKTMREAKQNTNA
jgi:DnaD/phage-associated family protein